MYPIRCSIRKAIYFNISLEPPFWNHMTTWINVAKSVVFLRVVFLVCGLKQNPMTPTPQKFLTPPHQIGFWSDFISQFTLERNWASFRRDWIIIE